MILRMNTKTLGILSLMFTLFVLLGSMVYAGCGPSDSGSINSNWFSTVSDNFNSGSTAILFSQNGEMLNVMDPDGVLVYNEDGTVNSDYDWFSDGSEFGYEGNHGPGTDPGGCLSEGDDNCNGILDEIECDDVGAKKCRLDNQRFQIMECKQYMGSDDNTWTHESYCSDGECCNDGECLAEDTKPDDDGTCVNEEYKEYECEMEDESDGWVLKDPTDWQAEWCKNPDYNLTVVLVSEFGDEVEYDELVRFVGYSAKITLEGDMHLSVVDFKFESDNGTVLLNQSSIERIDVKSYETKVPFNVSMFNVDEKYDFVLSFNYSLQSVSNSDLPQEDHVYENDDYFVDKLTFVPFPLVVIS